MLDNYYEKDLDVVRSAFSDHGASFRQGTTESEMKALYFALMFSSYAPAFKHSSFRDEREWRAVYLPPKNGNIPKFRNSKTGPVPYLAFSLRKNGDFNIHEIVVGPSLDKEATMLAYGRFIDGINGRNDSPFDIRCGTINATEVPIRSL